MNEKDRATIDFLAERAKTESMNYLTVNELRGKMGLGDVEGGEVVLGIIKNTKLPSFQSERPDPKARRPEEATTEE